MKPVSPLLASSRRAFPLLALALVVVGCASEKEIVVINQQPDGITLRYDARYPTMAGVEADEHCAKYGRLAELAEIRKDDSITHPDAAIGVYDCVEK